MREALITKKGWKDESLPCEKSIGNILNRLDYRLRRVQKTKPIKKIKETDSIFENLDRVNKASDIRKDSLRISIDTKAKVDLCDSSRGGTSRCKKATQADDHDMGIKPKLVPVGILDVMGGLLNIIFGTSLETSDFIVDCLEQWWESNKERYSHIDPRITCRIWEWPRRGHGQIWQVNPLVVRRFAPNGMRMYPRVVVAGAKRPATTSS